MILDLAYKAIVGGPDVLAAGKSNRWEAFQDVIAISWSLFLYQSEFSQSSDSLLTSSLTGCPYLDLLVDARSPHCVLIYYRSRAAFILQIF